MNKFVGHRVILRNGKVTDTKVEIDHGEYPLCAMIDHKKYRWTRDGSLYYVGESEWDIVDIYGQWIPLTDPNHVLRPNLDYARPIGGIGEWKPVVDVGSIRKLGDFPLYDFAYKATPSVVHCGGPYVTREAYDRVVKELADLKRKIGDLLNG
jgi:hypothetical protein